MSTTATEKWNPYADPKLLALADKLNEHHAMAQKQIRGALDNALECGRLLCEAKSECPHGSWSVWLKRNCPKISDRTAQLYMRLHRHAPQLKAQHVADLTLN